MPLHNKKAEKATKATRRKRKKKKKKNEGDNTKWHPVGNM
jgi:hypothetical protein